MEQDYEIGCMIKDQIVPKAVCWYTGEAASHDDDDDDMVFFWTSSAQQIFL